MDSIIQVLPSVISGLCLALNYKLGGNSYIHSIMGRLDDELTDVKEG